MAAELAQRDAAVVAHPGVVGGECQRRVVARQRLGRAVEVEQRVAAILHRVDVVRLERQGAVVARQRLGVAAEVAQRVAAVVVRLREARFQRQRPVVARQRLVGTPELAQREPEVGVRGGVVRIDAQRRGDEVDAVPVAALLVADDAQEVHRREMRRLRREDGRISRSRLLEPAALVQRDRLGEVRAARRIARRLAIVAREGAACGHVRVVPASVPRVPAGGIPARSTAAPGRCRGARRWLTRVAFETIIPPAPPGPRNDPHPLRPSPGRRPPYTSGAGNECFRLRRHPRRSRARRRPRHRQGLGAHAARFQGRAYRSSTCPTDRCFHPVQVVAPSTLANYAERGAAPDRGLRGRGDRHASCRRRRRASRSRCRRTRSRSSAGSRTRTPTRSSRRRTRSSSCARSRTCGRAPTSSAP